MPIFLNENQSLNKNSYKLPKFMKKHLQKTVHKYGDHTDERGYKRLMSMVDPNYNNRSNNKQKNNEKSITYAELKRWNHELKHSDKSDDNSTYEMNGGDEALNYTQNLLSTTRKNGRCRLWVVVLPCRRLPLV